MSANSFAAWIMFNIEIYIFMPKHKYAYRPKLTEYAEAIVESWELGQKTMFTAEVKVLTWDDNEKEWVARMAQNRTSQDNLNTTI